MPRHGKVLVAIMSSTRDFAILQDRLWYRVPVDKEPRGWSPDWLAFYQTKVFDAEHWTVHYYGRVASIGVRTGPSTSSRWQWRRSLSCAPPGAGPTSR
jgi:hypothetical protein